MTTRRAPSLAEVQSRFQAAILDGADDVLGLIPGNSRTNNGVLLGVYRHAYVARLVEVVRDAYPLLARLMGEAAFDAMARAYVAAYPSRTANARWYAARVSELLERERYARRPELSEMARLERQLDDAFDALDAPVLDLAALAALPPETWSGLAFEPHPSASVLTFTTNAFDIWVALKSEARPPDAALLAEPRHYLVWRRAGTATARALSGEEHMLWTEAARGVPFGRLAELAAVHGGSDTAALRVAQALQGWLSAGLLSATRDLAQVRD